MTLQASPSPAVREDNPSRLAAQRPSHACSQVLGPGSSCGAGSGSLPRCARLAPRRLGPRPGGAGPSRGRGRGRGGPRAGRGMGGARRGFRYVTGKSPYDPSARCSDRRAARFLQAPVQFFPALCRPSSPARSPLAARVLQTRGARVASLSCPGLPTAVCRDAWKEGS